ncbi:hypothetical protein OG21DRAFT_1419570, partial [Imleria badia]
VQSQLLEGATLIFSSDKTNITNLCGSRVAHPLLISLANIKMSTHIKLSSRSFMVTALLPVPKFIHKNKCMCSILEDQLIHQCLDVVLKLVRKAMQFAVMLLDAEGNLCYCFTPIAGYITDTSKATMIACVRGKMSPVTLAMFKQFGNSFWHRPGTAPTTQAQLSVAKSEANPADLQAFFQKDQHFHLNVVSKLFWRNYSLSGFNAFITRELFHYLHKEFWDHDMQ